MKKKVCLVRCAAYPQDMLVHREATALRDLVSVVDIFPSIVDLLEPGAELKADLAGNSFLPIHNIPVRDRIFAEYGYPKSMRALESLHSDFQTETLRHAYKTVSRPWVYRFQFRYRRSAAFDI
jgi:hypothetical protein